MASTASRLSASSSSPSWAGSCSPPAAPAGAAAPAPARAPTAAPAHATTAAPRASAAAAAAGAPPPPLAAPLHSAASPVYLRPCTERDTADRMHARHGAPNHMHERQAAVQPSSGQRNKEKKRGWTSRQTQGGIGHIAPTHRGGHISPRAAYHPPSTADRGCGSYAIIGVEPRPRCWQGGVLACQSSVGCIMGLSPLLRTVTHTAQARHAHYAGAL